MGARCQPAGGQDPARRLVIELWLMSTIGTLGGQCSRRYARPTLQDDPSGLPYRRDVLRATKWRAGGSAVDDLGDAVGHREVVLVVGDLEGGQVALDGERTQQMEQAMNSNQEKQATRQAPRCAAAEA